MQSFEKLSLSPFRVCVVCVVSSKLVVRLACNPSIERVRQEDLEFESAEAGLRETLCGDGKAVLKTFSCPFLPNSAYNTFQRVINIT